jgi:hypothetical protein
MSLNRGLFPLLCALASFIGQACVEYLPPPDYPAHPAVQESPPAAPQPPAYPASSPDSIPQPPAPPSPSPDARLDALLGPIALYPDPLIAILLPASTYPADIAAAAAYLAQYGDAAQVDNQPWDPSVRALAHYPSVVAWMASNLDWTTALGQAFAASPASVMDSVQRLRAKALAAGTLITTAQQQVREQDSEIEIVPAEPDAIYIPVYDPEVVYSADPYYGYGGPFINFGSPCPAGIWLSYGFDWRSHRVWAGGSTQGRWRQNNYSGDHVPPGARTWHPPAAAQSAPTLSGRSSVNVAPRPQPMPGAPNPPPEHYKRPPPIAAGVNAGSGSNYPGVAAPPQTRPRLNGPPSPGIPDMTVRQPSNPPIQYEPPTVSSRAEAPPAGAPVRDFSPRPERAPPEAAPRTVAPSPAAPHESAPHQSAPHEAAPVQQASAPDPKNQNQH